MSSFIKSFIIVLSHKWTPTHVCTEHRSISNQGTRVYLVSTESFLFKRVCQVNAESILVGLSGLYIITSHFWLNDLPGLYISTSHFWLNDLSGLYIITSHFWLNDLSGLYIITSHFWWKGLSGLYIITYD